MLTDKIENLLDNEKYEEAIILCDKAISAEPDNGILYLYKLEAMIYGSFLENKDYCYELANKGIELNPNIKNSYSYSGYIKYVFEDYEEAIKDFDKAVELGAESALVFFLRGNSKFQLGLYIEAIDDYDIVLEIEPEDYKAYYNRSVVKDIIGDLFGALEDCRNALKINPDYESALTFYKELKEIYENELANAEKELEQNPTNAESHFKVGQAKAHRGDYEGAIQAYTKALDYEEDFSTYNNRANAKFILGDFEGAILDYQKSIELSNNESIEAKENIKRVKSIYVEKLRNTADKYLENSKYKKAIEIYTKIIEINSIDELAYINRGIAKYNLKDFKNAILDYDKAIEINPESALAYYNKGVLNMEHKHLKIAINDFSNAIKCDPKDTSSYVNRGNCKQELRDYDGAISDYEKALKIDPYEFDAQRNLKIVKQEAFWNKIVGFFFPKKGI